MKKLFLVGALALSTVFAASAQDLEGKWFVGGELGFNSTNNKGEKVKTSQFSVLPTIGTFISSDIAVGAGLGYSSSNVKEDGTKTLKVDGFTFQPLVRKYWSISGGFHFFGQAALPLTFGNIKYPQIENSKTSVSSYSLQLAPGFDYIINEKFSIETSFTIFDVNYSRVKPKGGDATTSFGINANPFASDKAITDKDGDIIGTQTGRSVGELRIGFKFLF